MTPKSIFNQSQISSLQMNKYVAIKMFKIPAQFSELPGRNNENKHFDACLASVDNFHNYAKIALTLNLRFLIMTCTHEYSSSDERALFVI